MARRRVVLDVDTGSDDAVAIMLAAVAPELDLVAVTAVSGNQPVEDVARNSAGALALVGRSDVPVVAGRAAPLAWPEGREVMPRSPEPADLDLGASGRVTDGDAVDVLARIDTGTTLVVTGPLTNVATALAVAPDLVDRVDEIVVMAGVTGRDPRLPTVETNVGHDPTAAAFVFAAPWHRLVHVPLDTTMSALATDEDVAALRKGGEASKVVADLVAARIERYQDHPAVGGLRMAPVHDPLLVVGLLDPDVWRLVPGRLAVEADLSSAAFGSSRLTEGEHHVATAVDTRRFLDHVIRRLAVA